MKKLRKLLTQFVVIFIFAALFSVIAVNVAIGCGQRIYYPNGSWETGSCFLIPYKAERSQ